MRSNVIRVAETARRVDVSTSRPDPGVAVVSLPAPSRYYRRLHKIMTTTATLTFYYKPNQHL